MATSTATTTKISPKEAAELKDLLLDINIRLIHLTRRPDIGFASLNLTMAQIQMLLITYHGSGIPSTGQDSGDACNRGSDELRAEMTSVVDNGETGLAIMRMKEDARERLGQLTKGFEEVNRIVERLNMESVIRDRDEQQKR
ncbi:MAG: hypothetical protein Q9180_004880 [Flavoplaca navasiana]